MTDEELTAIKLPDCKVCEGLASVRHAGGEWWYVGCICPVKHQCTREFVMECVEDWKRRHGK